MSIPIRNLYYLLLYAWDHFREGKDIDVGQEASPDLPNLLARVLISGTHRLLRRGLDRGYRPIQQALSSPRGRLLLENTAKRAGFQTGRLDCEFDELNHDIAHNRIIRSALNALSRRCDVNADLRSEMHGISKRLHQVTEFPLTSGLFRQLQLSRNSGHYGLLMQVCRMVLEVSQPTQEGEGSTFRSILDDEVRMSALFETFLRNFYRLEQNEFEVSAAVVPWIAQISNEDHRAFLPNMKTDVTLRSGLRHIVIDAKFYKQILVSNQGGAPKIQSPHLYQLLTYLTNVNGKSKVIPEGILLYANAREEPINLSYVLAGFPVRVFSVDLRKAWTQIHCELISLLSNECKGMTG